MRKRASDSNEEQTGSKPCVDWRNEESFSGEKISSKPIRSKKIPKRFEDYRVTTLLSMVDSSISDTYEVAINSSESSL